MLQNVLEDFVKNCFGLEICIFVGSFFFCLIPKGISKIDKLRKWFNFLNTFSAGCLLGILLLDFTPHMFEGSDKFKHDLFHIIINVRMISAGLSVLCLIAFDQCVIKHDHCKETTEDTGGNHECTENIEDGIRNNGTCSLEIESNSAGHSHTRKIEDLGCCNTKMLQNTQSKLKALIYIVSISIHSFFEGLSMKPNEFGTYEWGIVIHKTLESFAIGNTLFNSAFNFKTCLGLNVIYSSLTPFGMMLGKLGSQYSLKFFEVPISALFDGLSFGSLIFIVFFEMIPGAFHKNETKMKQILTLCAGFITAAIMITMTHSHHSHSHHHH